MAVNAISLASTSDGREHTICWREENLLQCHITVLMPAFPNSVWRAGSAGLQALCRKIDRSTDEAALVLPEATRLHARKVEIKVLYDPIVPSQPQQSLCRAFSLKSSMLAAPVLT